jgi:hypothetical protein
MGPYINASCIVEYVSKPVMFSCPKKVVYMESTFNEIREKESVFLVLLGAYTS